MYFNNKYNYKHNKQNNINKYKLIMIIYNNKLMIILNKLINW